MDAGLAALLGAAATALWNQVTRRINADSDEKKAIAREERSAKALHSAFARDERMRRYREAQEIIAAAHQAAVSYTLDGKNTLARITAGEDGVLFRDGSKMKMDVMTSSCLKVNFLSDPALWHATVELMAASVLEIKGIEKGADENEKRRLLQAQVTANRAYETESKRVLLALDPIAG